MTFLLGWTVAALELSLLVQYSLSREDSISFCGTVKLYHERLTLVFSL